MSRPLVLVVDDDASIRGLVQASLAGHGFEIVEAPEGETALQLAAERSPDVVVLDWRMPGATGFEILTTLTQAHPDARVVFMSAELRNAQAGLAHIYGAHAFLEKPFSPQRLLEVVQQLLD